MRLVKSILPVLMLWVGKLIIDEVVLQVDFSEKNFTELWFLLGLEFGLAVISNLFSRIISLTDGLLGDLYANKSSVELIQKSAKLELAQLEDSVFYDKLERARRQTTNRISLMSNVLSQGQDIITVISLITGLIVFEPWLIVLLFIAIIPSFINEIKFSRTSYSLQRSWTPERRELDYLRFIGASDQTAKEVKLFGLANYISTKFAEVAHRYYLANRKLSIQRSLWGSLFNIIGDVAYYWAYLVIIMQTVSGIITIGAMTFLSGSFSRLRGQLQTIFSRFSRITESAMYLQDYFDFIDIETEEDRTEVFQKIPEKIQTGFSFENVSFKYPESEKFVLKNITFSLKKGEKLALVGENGAGKTTLVKLLLRMYEPDEGRILLDGKDIRNYPKSEYQQLFGAIFQDFVKYYFTAGENIGIGYVKEIENRPRVEISAEKSLADKVIADLPENYNQRLGKRFNDGKDLSGGQWQKIALGRAYMKDAEIIVLDEPTAALDARAEYEAFERFVELTKGKTSVIISHRFSTVRMAERILVLKNGTILELGSHEDLLANEGLYAELFELQAKGYQ
ncbi:MAG: ABC transporter ATP-binding protein [Saprospiraceae bacterium]|nr:ABC transporter ATP-binding protein [Saprospiraceae bacterium]